MIPQAFDYERPASVEEVLELLADDAIESALLAGGHSLLPLMKLRLATPARVIDLGGIDGLDAISTSETELRIGAMATHATIARSEDVRSWAPIGGSCAYGHPAADWPPALIAVGAGLVCRGRDGERRIAAEDAFLGAFTTALEDEVLTEIVVPRPPANGGDAYRKLVRPSGDYAVAGVGVQLGLADDGTISHAGIGVTAVSDAPFAASAAVAELIGARPSTAVVEAAAAAVAEASDPLDDLHASAGYRRAMAAEMTRRALGAAIERATGSATERSGDRG